MRHRGAPAPYSTIFQAQSGLPVNLFAGTEVICSAGLPNASNTCAGSGTTLVTLPDPLLLGAGNTSGTGVVRPNQVGPINVHLSPNPGAGANNPNKIPGSGLAQPLVGQFGTLGRNVIRENPYVQADMGVGRDFKIMERFTFRLQMQVFNVFNNTTFTFGTSTNSLSAPTTFGYYNGTDTNSRRVALIGRLVW